MVKRLSIIFGAAFLLLLLPLSWSSRLRDIATRAVHPIGTYLIRHNTGLFNAIKSVQQIPSLRDDKSRLQNEVVSLQQSLSDKQTIVRENEALRKEVGVTGATKDTKKVLAHVVLQGSDPLDRTFIIDVGSDQDIALGQAAISQGSLIGRVITIRPHSAVIRSILSKESRVQSWISDTREKGLLIGDGNSVYLSDITQGVTVSPSGIVETSGLGGSLPQGILIGTIGETRSKKSDLSQSFSVNPAQDPLQVESLFIVLTDSQ